MGKLQCRGARAVLGRREREKKKRKERKIVAFCLRKGKLRCWTSFRAPSTVAMKQRSVWLGKNLFLDRWKKRAKKRTTFRRLRGETAVSKPLFAGGRGDRDNARDEKRSRVDERISLRVASTGEKITRPIISLLGWVFTPIVLSFA